MDLLSQPERLRAMGPLGVEFVSRHYSWDHITEQLLEVYLEGLQRYRVGNES